MPGVTAVRVRGVQVHGKRRDEAHSGQRTAVNLGGVDAADITRGQSVAAPGSLTVTRRLDATLDLLPTARALKHGARVRFHQGTSETLGRVSIAGTGRAEIQPGTQAHVRIRLEAPAALTRGDRFIVRAYSPTVTIGGGEVLDPEPPRAGARTVAGEQRFAALAQDGVRAISRMIADTEGHGLPVGALVSRAGVAPPRVEGLVSSLARAGHARRVGDRLLAPAVMQDLSAKLLTVVGDFHRSHPLLDGVPREEARERVFARAHPAVFEDVLSAIGGIRTTECAGSLGLAQPSPRALARRGASAAVDRGGLFAGGAQAARRGDTGRRRADISLLVEKMTALLLRQKVLARLDTLVFHVETLDQLKADIQALKSAAPGGRATVDVATFKDRYGVTRKFAIPLLEWLDRERVTRRMGDTRVVL